MIAASLLCAAALPAFAQAPGGGAGGGMGAVLTQEQRTKMRESMQTSQGDVTQLTEKLAAAQKEAVKAALAKDADEKTVRAKVEAVAKLQTDMAMLRLKAVKEIAASVTEEQKTQMDSRPGVAYNMLLGSMGGMGGGGRGGAGGGTRGGGNQ